MIEKNNLMKDLGIIAISIVVAIIAVKTEALKDLLTSSQESRIVGSFLAGMFFVSAFTIAPASVALVEIAQANSLFLVAFFGGLGALVGDLIIFRFIKDRLSEDFIYLIKKARQERFLSVFRLQFFKFFTPFVGALIVASPLPDEVGLAMMGFSKMKSIIFIPVSFFLNFLGILAIGFIF